MQQPTNRKKHQQKILIKKRKRILITSLLAVVLFMVSMAATLGIYSWLNPEIDLFAWMHPVQKTEEGEEVPVLKERFNLLVLGVDERLDDLGRSDTMLFFSVPSDGSQPLLISIPRDTMIWKKELQIYDRINNIYPTDGIDATVQMVRNLFGVPVDGYIKVNIEGFVELIDIMGGVRIVVDEAMDYEDPYQDLYIHIQPGDQILDGQTSMEYVRFRADGTGDIGRIARQQKFLKAAMDQALSVNNLSKIPNMIRQGFSMIETNISINKLLSLANTIIRNGISDFHSAMLPGDGLYYGDASVWMLRLEEMYTLIAELMIPDDRDEMYLNLLQQKWIVDYQKIHDEALAKATAIWEETGMWLSDSEYAAWKSSQVVPDPEPKPEDPENPEEPTEPIEPETPEDPTEPINPDEPVEPEKPVDPTTPITPPVPITP
jgi:LCP family protein required for cell wall assembly